MKCTRMIVAAMALLLVGALAMSAVGEGTVTADVLVKQWASAWPIQAEIQTFPPEEGILAELVVVSERDALQTAIEAILRIEGIAADALTGYTPDIVFKAIGTEYTYDVRLTPPDAAAQHYYVEVGASFPDNMIRYHVLSADGTQTLSIKFFSGPAKEIREQSYQDYTAERSGG